jgi:hypothetical protein
LKPYRLRGFQNSGGEIINRNAEADRLEAGGLSPIGGKLREAGLTGISRSSEAPNFKKKIATAKTIRVAYLFSNRFIKDNYTELEKALKNGAKVELIFLSEKSRQIQQLVEAGWNPTEITGSYQSIRKLVEELEKLGDIRLRFHNNPRANSVVQIDDVATVSFVSLSNGRMDIPRLTIERGGSLFDFVEKDLDRLSGQYEKY